MATANRDTAYEVEQFLYREARLLDEERLHEWLDLFTEDARYFMPVRQTIQGRPAGVYEEDEFAVALIRDDKEFLTKRVLRLDSGLAHAETPPSRTRHLITNVEVIVDGADDEVIVHSNFVLFQGRRDRMSYQFYGKREDRLRRVDGAWKIAQRKVVLDHVVLPRGLSVLF
jgi:3-phenylpropionate/cinnamic acid dioxygenase small subunit